MEDVIETDTYTKGKWFVDVDVDHSQKRRHDTEVESAGQPVLVLRNARLCSPMPDTFQRKLDASA